MPSQIQNVIVAGATGNLGPYILAALQSANFNVSALARSGSSTNLPDNVTVKKTDYSATSLVSVLQGQDALISLLPVTATDTQLALVDAAASAGVQRFLPSEFGWSPDRPIPEALKKRLEGKARVIERLQRACGGDSRMSWTAIVSGVFLDWVLYKVPVLGFRMADRKAKIYDSGNESITGSTGKDMGVAVVGVLTHLDETRNRFVKIRSTKLSQNGLHEALQEVTGTAWEVERVNTTEVVKIREQKIKEGRFLEALPDTLVLALFTDGAGCGMVVDRQESDNELLGIEEKNVKTTAQMLLDRCS